ncbi:GNAT family N-acetyltransferase [Pontivivens ytuae]|uniref:Acetyltransferase n=1 Tax=Pontivivens ytuae TaxID=2789856 RepID=A0A7S9QE27_9RHOB|nr:GNAT family N-acetyltransferase [Pontivivens ytuae]QPH55598.1 acetyltransferase [Pontivivens ytuae]
MIATASNLTPPLSLHEPRALAEWIETQLSADPTLQTLALPIDPAEVQESPRRPGYVHLADDCPIVHRSGFYQHADLWLRHPPAQRQATTSVDGPDGRDHPLRPPNPTGTVYEKRFADAAVTVSFRVVDIERDLDIFHRWQNDPRVAYFWEEDKSKDDLRAFLEKRLSDPHNLSVIGCYDDQPVGYFEIYWAREDRLGAYYDAGPWDRGWHGLIGEAKHLGRRKTSAWIRALTHYLFLDCPMTDLVVGEPRVDNVKLLRYADAMAYTKIKEFDFPHKRSALMHCPRDAFFARVPL